MVFFSSSLKIRGVVRDEGEEEIFAAIYCQMCCAKNNRKPTKCQKDLDFYVSLHVSFVSQTMPANFETCDPKEKLRQQNDEQTEKLAKHKPDRATTSYTMTRGARIKQLKHL